MHTSINVLCRCSVTYSNSSDDSYSVHILPGYVLLVCCLLSALQTMSHAGISGCLLNNLPLTVTVSQHICLVELWENVVPVDFASRGSFVRALQRLTSMTPSSPYSNRRHQPTCHSILCYSSVVCSTGDYACILVYICSLSNHLAMGYKNGYM